MAYDGGYSPSQADMDAEASAMSSAVGGRNSAADAAQAAASMGYQGGDFDRGGEDIRSLFGGQAAVSPQEQMRRALEARMAPIPIQAEIGERGLLETAANHLVGVVPGVNVQAYNYYDPHMSKPLAAPSKTSFDAFRAAADLGGMALGIPSAGAMFDTVRDKFSQGRQLEDGLSFDTTTAAPTMISDRPAGASGGFNRDTGGESTGYQAFTSAPAAAGLQPPGTAPISFFMPSYVQALQNRRGIRPSFAAGGFVGDMVQAATDQSFAFRDPGIATRGVPGNPIISPGYAMGGEVVAPGQQAGVAPPQASGKPMPMQAMQQEAQRLAQQRPQEVAQIKQAVASAMQSGQLSPQELNMATQLAMAAAQNPQLYPQLRQFAINQGLATEQDLPQQYDEGLIFTLLMIGEAAQQQIPQANGQPPIKSMAGGGPLPANSRNSDGSIPITAHEGEYVIPAHIVRKKGTDFFDKLTGKVEGQTSA